MLKLATKPAKSLIRRVFMAYGFNIVPQHRKLFPRDPSLPEPFAALTLSGETLHQLLHHFAFTTVLDVGAGEGVHAAIMRDHGKTVTELDFGKSVYFQKRNDGNNAVVCGDFLEFVPEERFDCIWASHVLEHQPNPGAFINHCIAITRDDGILAITVPPRKDAIVGGHLTLWNAGLLLYQLVFAGLDCREAAVRTYGYNVSVIVRKARRPAVELDYDHGDIDRLAPYLPPGCAEGFDGCIREMNWRGGTA